MASDRRVDNGAEASLRFFEEDAIQLAGGAINCCIPMQVEEGESPLGRVYVMPGLDDDWSLNALRLPEAKKTTGKPHSESSDAFTFI